jgi:hypothetical protein
MTGVRAARVFSTTVRACYSCEGRGATAVNESSRALQEPGSLCACCTVRSRNFCLQDSVFILCLRRDTSRRRPRIMALDFIVCLSTAALEMFLLPGLASDIAKIAGSLPELRISRVIHTTSRLASDDRIMSRITRDLLVMKNEAQK